VGACVRVGGGVLSIPSGPDCALFFFPFTWFVWWCGVPKEWTGQAAQKELAWLRKQHRPGGAKASGPAGSPCEICREPVDYGLRHPHPESLTLHHVRPKSRYPHLTWVRTNYAPAHKSCNERLGDREESPGGSFDGVYW
jgi:5-methylcytosine-specific restriction endonuclease McrA